MRRSRRWASWTLPISSVVVMEADRKGKPVVAIRKRGRKESSRKDQVETPNRHRLLGISLSQLGKREIKTDLRAKLRERRTSPRSSATTAMNFGHKKSECKKFARDQKAKIGTLQAQLAAVRAQASQGAPQQAARPEDQPSRKN